MGNIKDLKAYRIVEEKDLPEVHGKGYVLEHIKTKARVLIIENDDVNKVFNIGFRTPPYDDSGIPHIIEHSVLCGSKKYPIKDPFVELAKGSLNTFLNAMTYSDKTVYPIASFNQKDFENIMSVYLDAVFYPDIYIHDEIMKQEGWHYELDSVDGDLKYNGVVYNEMKGVYSSPESIMYREIESLLMPDTPYGNDSGGDPLSIPTLTLERFRDFHRTYYHPSNSYIYLYGDCDMAKELEFIDEEYLSHYDYKEIDSVIPLQKPFDEMKDITMDYSIADTDPEENNSILTYSKITGLSTEKKKVTALGILEYVLMDAPGAVLKKALTDAGIGEEVYSSFDNGCQQTTFSIIARGADKNDKDRFIKVIDDTFEELSHGVDKAAIEAAINKFEFKHKEANFGRFPKGLMYGLDAFNSWLYDDTKALMFFEMNDVYKELREDLQNGYFEQLIKECFIDNTFGLYLTMNPKKGLDQENEKKIADELAAYKATLSREELEKIVEDTKALKEYQATPSSAEDLAKVPLLSIDDIDKEAEKLKNVESEIGGLSVVSHDIFTNGIGYLRFYFNINDIDNDLVPYLAVLSCLFKYIDTEKHTYGQLSNEIDSNIGGIEFDMVGYASDTDIKKFFYVSMKALYEKLPYAVELMKEIMFSSKIDDRKRLKELLTEEKSSMKNGMAASGHVTAYTRAMSYIDEGARFTDETCGIAYYEFLCDIVDHFDEKYDNIIEKLQYALAEVLRKGALTVSYTGDQDVTDLLEESFADFGKALSTRPAHKDVKPFEKNLQNEGFKTASQVQYVAIAGNFENAGYKYDSSLSVLKIIFSYGYLWENVRVKGGAYGAMCSFLRNGTCYMSSYRDPNLMETYDIFKNAYKFVENFECSDRDMTKYIIGTMAQIDAPTTPVAEGISHMARYFMGVTDEQIQSERDKILSTDRDAIRALAPLVKAVTDSGIICAIGGESKIEENKDNFKDVLAIF